MAVIWCINKATYRPGVNEVGDTIDVLEDWVGPGGDSTSFDGIAVTGIPAETVNETLKSLVPDKDRAFRAATTKWTLTRPEEVTVWENTDGKWYFLAKSPKYKTNLASLTDQQKVILADTKVSNAVRLTILSSNAQEKCAMDSQNLIEATELNE